VSFESLAIYIRPCQHVIGPCPQRNDNQTPTVLGAPSIQLAYQHHRRALRPCAASLLSSCAARLLVLLCHVCKSAERASVGVHVLAACLAVAPAPPLESCPAASSSAATAAAGRTGRCHVQQRPWADRKAQSTRAGTSHPPIPAARPELITLELFCKGRADYHSIPNQCRANVPTRHNRKTHE
jgi:hypothetical protein